MPYLDKVGRNCLLYSAKMWWAALLQTESLSLLTPISTVGESEVEFSPNTQGSLLSADNAYVPWSSHLSFCLFVNTQDSNYHLLYFLYHALQEEGVTGSFLYILSGLVHLIQSSRVHFKLVLLCQKSLQRQTLRNLGLWTPATGQEE